MTPFEQSQLNEIQRQLENFKTTGDESHKLFFISNVYSLAGSLRGYYLAKLGLLENDREKTP